MKPLQNLVNNSQHSQKVYNMLIKSKSDGTIYKCEYRRNDVPNILHANDTTWLDNKEPSIILSTEQEYTENKLFSLTIRRKFMKICEINVSELKTVEMSAEQYKALLVGRPYYEVKDAMLNLFSKAIDYYENLHTNFSLLQNDVQIFEQV